MSETAPLRVDTPALSAAEQAVVLAPPAAAPAPTNPATILAQHAPEKPKSSRKWMLYAAGGIITAQLVMPTDLKPNAIVGEILAGFYVPIMQANTANHLTLARQQALAEKIAELEARRADALGNCMWGGIFGPEGVQVCRQLVNERFNSSLANARYAAGVR